MMELFKAFAWIILGFFSGVILIVFLWFVIGMSINFYKIYIKKPKQKSNEFDNYLN